MTILNQKLRFVRILLTLPATLAKIKTQNT